MSENIIDYDSVQRDLVAGLIFDDSKVDRVLEIISVDDFSDPQLGMIMQAISELARRDEKISAVAIAHELESVGNLKKAGGTEMIYQLYIHGQKVLLNASLEIYARTLREFAARYNVSQLLKEYENVFVEDSGINAKNGISQLQNLLSDEMLRLADNATVIEVDKYISKDYFDLLDERERIRKENEGKANGLQGIPTPLPSLDRYTSGFMPQQLITVGARTGIGKSVFAIMTALKAAEAGKSVLFFSLEMSHQQIIDRLVANKSGVSLSKLKDGRLNEEERDRVIRASNALAEMKITVDTDAAVSIDSVRSKALRLAQSEKGLDIIVLDYLQLLDSKGVKGSSRQEIVSYFSRSMKLLAKSLNIPVMVLTQVNRLGKDDTEDKPPRTDDIRESGSIAQDSDIVILLHREKGAKDNDQPNETYVILGKNRDGVSDKTIVCYSHLDRSNLVEMTRKERSDNPSHAEVDEVVNGVSQEHYSNEYDDDLSNDSYDRVSDSPDF